MERNERWLRCFKNLPCRSDKKILQRYLQFYFKKKIISFFRILNNVEIVLRHIHIVLCYALIMLIVLCHRPVHSLDMSLCPVLCPLLLMHASTCWNHSDAKQLHLKCYYFSLFKTSLRDVFTLTVTQLWTMNNVKGIIYRGEHTENYHPLNSTECFSVYYLISSLSGQLFSVKKLW